MSGVDIIPSLAEMDTRASFVVQEQCRTQWDCPEMTRPKLLYSLLSRENGTRAYKRNLTPTPEDRARSEAMRSSGVSGMPAEHSGATEATPQATPQATEAHAGFPRQLRRNESCLLVRKRPSIVGIAVRARNGAAND